MLYETLPLTKGFNAILDIKDYEQAIRYSWYADVNPWNIYAKTDSAEGRPRLHVFVMRPPKGLIVHHKDGDGLNNRRDNLEIMTQAEHSRLSKLRKNKESSSSRGVYKHVNGGYCTEIWRNYTKHYLGYFQTEEEASIAYEKARQLLDIRSTKKVEIW